MSPVLIVVYLSLCACYRCSDSVDSETSSISTPLPQFSEESNDSEPLQTYPLSDWHPLEELTLKRSPLSRDSIADLRSDLRKLGTHLLQSKNLRTRSLSPPQMNPTQKLMKRHLLCDSDREGSYLMHFGDQSPALHLSAAPNRSDHLALFIFDLDAEPPQMKAMHPQSNAKRNWRARVPRLLWAVTGLDRNLRFIPEGFGGVGLKLGGKSNNSSIEEVHQLANDYTEYFYSPYLRGQYYGYDGPCIRWDDPLRQHRILAIAISTDLTSAHIRSALDKVRDPLLSHPRSLLAWQSFALYIQKELTKQRSTGQQQLSTTQIDGGYWSYAIWQTPL